MLELMLLVAVAPGGGVEQHDMAGACLLTVMEDT